MKIKKFHKMLARRYPDVAPDPEALNRDLIKKLMQCHLNHKLKKLDEKARGHKDKIRKAILKVKNPAHLKESYCRGLAYYLKLDYPKGVLLTKEQKQEIWTIHRDHILNDKPITPKPARAVNCRKIESNRLTEKLQDMQDNPKLYRPTFNY